MERQRLPGQFCCALSSQELVMELPLVRQHFYPTILTDFMAWVRKISWSWNLLSMEAKYSQSASVGTGWLNLKILRLFLVFFWAILLISLFPNFCFKAMHEPDLYQSLWWLGCVLSKEERMGWWLPCHTWLWVIGNTQAACDVLQENFTEEHFGKNKEGEQGKNNP